MGGRVCEVGCMCGRHRGRVYTEPWRTKRTPDEARRNRSEAARRRWENPEYRAKISEASRSQAEREDRAARARASWASLSPEQRKARGQRCAAARIGRRQSPQEIENRAQALRRYWTRVPEAERKRRGRELVVKRNRARMTDNEVAIAAALRFAQVTYEYQAIVGDAVVDFLVPEVKLVIETDGAYWHDRAKDGARDEALSRLGYEVIRIPHDAASRDPVASLLHSAILKGHARGI